MLGEGETQRICALLAVSTKMVIFKKYLCTIAVIVF